LRAHVRPDDVEASARVTHRTTAGPAEQVK
jgi:hypothetical protein